MYKSLIVLAAAVASASAFVPAPRSAISRTVVRAEDKDWEAEWQKVKKEAEDRLDNKVEELMSNIENVGVPKEA